MKKLLDKYSFKSEMILSELNAKDKRKVQSAMEPITFSKGDMMFYEDGIPNGVFLLTQGRAKIFKKGWGDRSQIFYIYKAGDLLGYHPLLCNERYQDSCETIENCETQFISADKFDKLLLEIPALKTTLIRNMSHEFGVMVNVISVIAQKSVRVRFALYLLLLNSQFENKGIN